MVQRALPRSEYDRSLILEFHHYGLEWTVAEILLLVLCGATPTHLAGFVLRGLGLAIGRGHGAVLVGQADHYPVAEMLVQRHFLMSGDLDANHANLTIFKLDLVVVGIDSHRVERGICLRGCTAGFLQHHLNDADRLVARNLRNVRSICRAPLHVARFEFQYRSLAALWSDLLAAGRQVDHHAIELVFVWLSFGVRLVYYLDHACLVIVDGDLRTLAGEAGFRRKEKRGEKRYISHWPIIQPDLADAEPVQGTARLARFTLGWRRPWQDQGPSGGSSNRRRLGKFWCRYSARYCAGRPALRGARHC